jgi:hypothetical protein
MAHYKCNSSPAWWRSFSIPKVPPQWGCTSCFLKFLPSKYGITKKNKKQNFMLGVASGKVALSSISCSPLILVMPSPLVGPYVACKRHCFGDYVNHHSLGTNHWKPNMRSQIWLDLLLVHGLNFSPPIFFKW